MAFLVGYQQFENHGDLDESVVEHEEEMLERGASSAVKAASCEAFATSRGDTHLWPVFVDKTAVLIVWGPEPIRVLDRDAADARVQPRHR